tara:strand:- start:137 stop:505 length:369 start_codon:yes stop_codon:yes gene_type:complete
MIAFLSNSIEITVIAFASGLLAVFPFLPASLVTHPEQIMVTIGFGGQGLFAMRFIVQWLTSEGQGRSVIPIAFWYFSIGGGAVLLLYAIWRQDPVIICGQGLGLFIYLRNLYLIHKSAKRDT